MTFCQRYKGSLNDADKELVKQVCKVESHHQITKEVRRELFGVQGFRNEIDAMEA